MALPLETSACHRQDQCAWPSVLDSTATLKRASIASSESWAVRGTLGMAHSWWVPHNAASWIDTSRTFRIYTVFWYLSDASTLSSQELDPKAFLCRILCSLENISVLNMSRKGFQADLSTSISWSHYCWLLLFEQEWLHPKYDEMQMKHSKMHGHNNCSIIIGVRRVSRGSDASADGGRVQTIASSISRPTKKFLVPLAVASLCSCFACD